MELKFLHILTYLSLALVASYAALPTSTGETYWNTKLPNTPMPKAIKESLLPSGLTEDKSTSVEVGKGGVNVNAGKGHHSGSGTNVNVGHKGVGVHTGKSNSGSGTNVNVGHKGVNVNTPRGTHVGVGKGGVGVTTPGHKGKPPVYVGVGKGSSPFVYNYAAKDDQLHDNPNVALFFQEKDLHQGSNMKLQFVKTTNGAAFLPRQVADATPFSSNKMPEILNQFSVDPNSEEAQAMKQTVQECEEPGVEGEEKYCATSLESMVDFSTSKLGNKVQPLATETDKENTQLQKYTILGAKKMGNNNNDGKSVVCHKQNYAYAVFYCHKTETTESYMVSLVGADGTKAKAVAVCHKDTSAWNPKHLAFKVLKVKPGSVPVCHFLPQDHIVWVPKN
ncbi:BURP domain-containing protein 3 [Capsicum annuum]|uniref:BURP domain protein RD22 n=1 Tax=Capsicum annuum TaxID=4072 RepID=UPI0007BFAADB|nr:BURP domain protein RD22 [Capsicum annuum]KAF3634928.1 BURP domain-containing protein 3 [Capsicum annuum]KAF3640930.1 BURP domain-containing protein 3 [Capsicum annuum]